MKTVEEVIEILKTFPPKSRLMVGDKFEGTTRDIESFKILSAKYVERSGFGRNNSPVIKIEVNKTDEFWESFYKEHPERRQNGSN